MNNQQVNEVSTHKHLGLYLSNNCSWHEHIEYIKAKAWQCINTMRRLKFDLDRKSLQIIYFSFIRPLLEYADIVWNNCTQYESLGLEQIQYEPARIVTGATRLVSINSLLTETFNLASDSVDAKCKVIRVIFMNSYDNEIFLPSRGGQYYNCLSYFFCTFHVFVLSFLFFLLLILN